MSHKRRTTLEKNIQRDIEAELGAEPDLLLLRNSVGQARYINEEDGSEYFVPFGLGKGSPDIVSLLRVVAKIGGNRASARMVATWFCLEVKPEEGELEDDQKKCHHVWRHFGAFIETVRSVDEAKRALARARKGES